MLYLAEREVGFDLDAIGFPSIDGCHAVVLQTESGLYGFHNFGGSGTSSFAERSQAFATFVSQHFVAKGLPIHLYGTCFRNKRGYADPDKLKAWKEEMKAFAAALGYKGPVSGYNLDLTGYGAKSAYVEYRRGPKGCTVHCKPWVEMSHTMSANTDRVNHRTTVPGGVKTLEKQVVDTVGVQTGPPVQDVPAKHLDTFNCK
ncbi:MAG TPA: hypothetical protein VFS08_16985 [Gemmatimonadaceae bacterium]|nr:hypothetical protein [Gemmatimonadaceae bacterium]